MDHRLHDVIAAEALIFDMDGLLFDTETLYFRATQHIVGPYGHTVRIEDYADWIGRHVTYADFQALYPCPLREDEWWTLISAEFHRLVESELAFRPGALEFLDTVAAGYPKAIASSTRVELIDRHLGQMGVRERFVARVSGRDVPRGKPAPDIFFAAAAALGVAPERCVVFEDSPHGVRGAHDAGMRTVAVPTEITAQCDFSLADLRVERLDQVTAAWLRGEG